MTGLFGTTQVISKRDVTVWRERENNNAFNFPR